MGMSTKSKQRLWSFSPSLYRALSKTNTQDEFSIGVAVGENFATIEKTATTAASVLTHAAVTDVPAAFVADPFVIRVDATWYMFFEIMNRLNYLGCIGCATSSDGHNWNYERVVLEEPFHLAYPCVFEHEGETFLVPDSIGNGVRLYRAASFPNEWKLEKTLIPDKTLCDSSLFRYQNRWWAFCCDRSDPQDTLRIFYANSLFGAWSEHAAGKICSPMDQRQAGRIIEQAGSLFRFVQNHNGEYVRMRQIETLTPEVFSESEYFENPILRGTGSGWNADGMHHIDLCFGDAGSYLAIVDGIRRNRRTNA